MKDQQPQNNVPRNVIIVTVAITVVFAVFRLLFFAIATWIVALAFIVIYQYKSTRTTESNFLCLDCNTVHQDTRCPRCGSRLKKYYTKNSNYEN
ncbi:MAG: hypothetical protein ABI340_03835 [Nitrososphaera sp.]|jgi:uncharacterized paraquat-inducible protein A